MQFEHTDVGIHMYNYLNSTMNGLLKNAGSSISETSVIYKLFMQRSIKSVYYCPVLHVIPVTKEFKQNFADLKNKDFFHQNEN